MQSRNPVFSRRDAFRPSAGYAAEASTMTSEQLQRMYDAPARDGLGTRRDRMTIDDVVARTAITLGTLILVAGLTWHFTNPSGGLLIGAALVGLGLGFVIGLKHVTNPAAILAYAVVEGVFVGMASKVLAYYVAGDPSIVGQAVLGTLCAAGGMLAVYKFRIIRVTPKFQRFVIGATMGFFALIMVNLLLSVFGVGGGTGLGLSGFGGLGLLMAVVGVALACFNLLLDFDYVEKGIATGAPSKDAWFAAFGLTVTLVWLYIEILRILAILRGGD